MNKNIVREIKLTLVGFLFIVAFCVVSLGIIALCINYGVLLILISIMLLLVVLMLSNILGMVITDIYKEWVDKRRENVSS